MYLVPLTQLESVELLIHSLKAAGGQADCTACPAYRVCMKQCLTIAGSIETMLVQGTLPRLGESAAQEPPDDGPEGTPPPKTGLRVIK